MRFGAHVSIAGSVAEAPGRGIELFCRTIQIFTKNARRWKARPIAAEDAGRFRAEMAEGPLWFVVAHNSYLINMADPAQPGWERSVEAMIDEVDRCEALGVPYLVAHPGAHRDSGEKAGLRRIAEALNAVHAARPKAACNIALEATAGQGTALGYRFEHFLEILGLVDSPERIAICLDTCHLFAAGYDLVDKAGYEATVRAFDEAVGLGRLALWHVNDSQKALGSRVDRHAHIGRGALGLKCFRRLVNDERFFATPMILETPKVEPGDDAMNLATLRRLVTGKAREATKTLSPREALPKEARPKPAAKRARKKA